jgi:archaellum component FlaC
VENRLTMARLQILAKERDLVISQASGEQRGQLHNLAGRRNKLEEAIRKMPKSEEGYRERQRVQLEKLQEMEKELNRLSILVINLGAQLVATEKYFQDTQAKRAKGVRESFAREAADVRRMVESLQEEVEDLSQSVTDAKAQAGVGGPEEVAERTLKANYREIVNQEHGLLVSLRGGVSGQKARDFDDLARLMSRCESVDRFIADFDKKLEVKVEQKLSTIRDTINDEKTKMVRYQTELADYQTRTNKVAGYLTYEGFRAVARRFYEIVVRADVGIIDVAWALKDAKSKEVSRLVRQRAMDLKMLDDEFKEVLRED